MDTVLIGKFLSELRHEQKLTQEQLGERLGISNKTVSRWENGNYMPPVEMLLELSQLYNVSVNEILSGKRLDDAESKTAAEENLKAVLEESPFSVEDKKRYFTKKWKTDHSLSVVIELLVCAAVILIGLFLKMGIVIIAGEFGSLAVSIINYNRMMSYVERNVYDDHHKK